MMMTLDGHIFPYIFLFRKSLNDLVPRTCYTDEVRRYGNLLKLHCAGVRASHQREHQWRDINMAGHKYQQDTTGTQQGRRYN
jgi:hypothetical protein